jgi:hypothetical protein
MKEFYVKTKTDAELLILQLLNRKITFVFKYDTDNDYSDYIISVNNKYGEYVKDLIFDYKIKIII